MKISDAIEKYKVYLEGSVEPSTAKRYVEWLNTFCAFLKGKDVENIEAVTVEDVIEYRAHLRTTQHEMSTIAARLAPIKGMIVHLRRQRGMTNLQLAGDDVAGLVPRVPKKLKGYLERYEVMAMVGACEDIEEEAVIRLLFTSGVRSQELLTLAPDSIRRDDKGDLWLMVKGKGNKERRVPLTANTYNAISKYREARRLLKKKQDTVLFPFSYSKLWRMVSEVAKRAGVKASPHILRHSYATELLDNDTDIRDIAEAMGHASLNTTMLYAKTKPRRLTEAAAKIDLGNNDNTGDNT